MYAKDLHHSVELSMRDVICCHPILARPLFLTAAPYCFDAGRQITRTRFQMLRDLAGRIMRLTGDGLAGLTG